MTDRQWFMSSELIGLPGMPSDSKGFARWVERNALRHPGRAWHAERNPDGIWRKRRARGGGYEYHLSALPPVVQARLVMDRAGHGEPPAQVRQTRKRDLARSASWTWFEGLSDDRRAKAREKLRILQEVETIRAAGAAKDVAVASVAALRQVGKSTIYEWFQRVAGLDAADWLPALADGYTGRTVLSDCDDAAWEFIKADWLRLERPTWESCYRRLRAAAQENAWTIPSSRTLRRRVEREIPRPVQVLARDGHQALKKLFPPQERDRGVFHALEAVNMDGHVWDVWVRWPDGTIGRPCMIALQDLYSGLILSWRIDHTENADVTRLAIGDMVETHGIPDHLWTDNGRAFASKWITGGTVNRYRFAVRPEEPLGILTTLGVQVHWTSPYSGQSKPIERAFRDFCDAIAKHPAFAGAWTGNRPDAKPENYRSRAIPLETFVEVVAQGVTEHNSRPGRRTRTANGRSFQQTFQESYVQSPIRRATAEQRRLWLLAAENVRTDRENGSIRLLNSRFWSEFLLRHPGQKVTVRFDPQDLHAGVHVYALDGRYLGFAECWEATGYADVAAARTHNRARRQWMKAQRAMLVAERKMTIDDVARLLPAPDVPTGPEAKVTRPLFRAPVSTRPVHDLPDTHHADEDTDTDADEALFRGLRLIRTVNE